MLVHRTSRKRYRTALLSLSLYWQFAIRCTWCKTCLGGQIKMKQNKQVEPALAIRFLREGFVPVYTKPEGFDQMDIEAKKAWAHSVLEKQSDQELFTAMADFADTAVNGYFDDTFEVQAIQDPSKFDTADESIFSTTAWDTFVDPEYGEDIVWEDKNFAEFVGSLGFTQDEITNIAIQKTVPSHNALDKLKLLDYAHSNALEAFRQEHGTMLVQKIKDDAAAPQLVKDLIDENKITYIGFDKQEFSEDYMPDHCVYMYLSGEILIGVRTEDQSHTYSEIDYTYGDFDIADGNVLLASINDYDLIEREIDKEEAAQAYKYLTDIVDTLEAQDRNTFRDYLLKRED